jgi:hypothetical protein
MAKKLDFKNSPAMGHLKKAGKAVVDYLGLNDPEPEKTRNDNFDTGSTEHLEPYVIRGRDGNQAAGMQEHFASKGYKLTGGSKDNVTNIAEGFMTPRRQAKNNGYK